MKTYIGFFGGVVAVSVLLHYAYQVIRGKAGASSVASWLMWTILDIILLITTWQAGKPVWLPLGWTIGASLITISLLRDGKWVWRKTETLSALCALVATVIWLTQGAIAGIVAGTFALNIAGIPILLDMINKPIPETFHVWFITCIACVITLFGADLTFVEIFLPMMSLLYNATMALIVISDNQISEDDF